MDNLGGGILQFLGSRGRYISEMKQLFRIKITYTSTHHVYNNKPTFRALFRFHGYYINQLCTNTNASHPILDFSYKILCMCCTHKKWNEYKIQQLMR